MSGRIVITLPKDRRQPGVLRLYAENGTQLFSAPCLGRSAGTMGNLARDPLKYRGDTPTGNYALTHVTHLARPIVGIGSIWIPLDPEAGQALEAEIAGRRGLGIHGGRGDRLLKVTHGCIRLTDRDMAALATAAGKLRFTVEIRDAAA